MTDPRQEQSAQAQPPRGSVVAVATALVLFWVLCAVASFLPNARLWGINHLAFYAWPIRAAALTVMAVSLLPPARRGVLRWLDRLSGVLASRRRLAALSLSVAAFILFHAFASSTELLGDGLYVKNNVQRAAKVDSETFVKVLKTPDPIYPGTEMLYLGVTRAASRALGVPPLAVLRVMIGLFGALLVFAVLASRRPSVAVQETRPLSVAAKDAGPASRSAPPTRLVPPPDLAPFVILAFLSGAVQIFFGYIEAYAPLMFFAALFLLSARRAIEGSAGLWVPTVCALAAVGMHRLGLVLLPSLGLVCLWVACRREWTRRFVWGAAVLAAVTIALPLAAALSGRLGASVLPLTKGERAYAVLSAGHLVDVANEILLVFPGFFVLVTVALLIARTGSHARRCEEGAAFGENAQGRGAQRAFPNVLFGLFVGAPIGVFLFFFRPGLGMARDWDLFAITALGLWAPVSASLERGRSNARTRGIVEYALPAVFVMTAVLTTAWIGVNANAGRSVARFESILSYDRTRAAYAYETLASYHNERKDLPAEIEALENAVAAARNPRHLLSLGLRYEDAGKKEKAVSTLQECLSIKPDYSEARKTLVQILLFMGRNDDVVTVCEEGAGLAPGDPHYPLFQGMAYVRQGRVSDARRAFDRSLSLKPAPDVANEIDKILRSLPPAPEEGRPDGEAREKTP